MTRSLPSRYLDPRPAQIKKNVSFVEHISAPLKGLSMASKSGGKPDSMFATILSNFVIEDDHIHVRAGYKTLCDRNDDKPVETLIPWYGDTAQTMLAASFGVLWDAQTAATVKSGFTKNDWHWTAFSNLSETDYTVMVNGADGVWSWDGTLAAAGVVKEAVTAPAGEPWIDPNNFHLVLAHMNRLWFADQRNLCLYYLPLQSKTGEVKLLPLNAVFRRGGSIRALATWTMEGGAGINDQLCIFSTNGECVIYRGIDPDAAATGDWEMVGIFRFDSPMSKHCTVNYGGDLYLLISTGLVPLSTLLAAETDNLGEADKNVVSLFRRMSMRYRYSQGWQVFLNPSSGRMFCNMPAGAEGFVQGVRHMPDARWSDYRDVPSRCWAWIEPNLYFGTPDGRVCVMHPNYFDDDGQPINVDVQMAWSNYRYQGLKDFKMVRVYLTTSGEPKPFLDIKTDYDYSLPENQPEVGFSIPGADWGAEWDTVDWATGDIAYSIWTGVSPQGNVGAPRLRAAIRGYSFAISGWDVIFEKGAIMG